MMTKKFFLLFIAFSILFTLGYPNSSAWKDPVLIAGEANIRYDKPVIQFGDAGLVYILFKYRNAMAKLTEIYLKTYDGKNLGVVGDQLNVSDTPDFTSYESDLEVTPTESVHVAWAEYSHANNSTHYIRHRWFDGNTWSEITTLGSIEAEHVEDLHMAVDSNNNAHVAFMIWPSAQCYLASKFGDEVRISKFPDPGRAKHPDVGVDDNFVHVVCQFRSAAGAGTRYTINYAKMPNEVGAAWATSEATINDHDCARPRMYLDENNYPHILYYEENTTGSARRLWYFYWNGMEFTGRKNVMNSIHRLFHFSDFAVRQDKVAVTVQFGQSKGGRQIYYNNKTGGDWQNPVILPGVSSPRHTSVDLSPDGTVSAVAYLKGDSTIYLIANGEITGALEAAFSNADRIFWGDIVTFDASQCAALNPDHNLVTYEWDFGDGTTETTSSPTITHSFNQYGAGIRVTLNIIAETGASGTVYKDIQIHALYNGIITSVESKQIRCLFYNRDANEIQWTNNPKNVGAGYPNITGYEIWRAPFTSYVSNYDYAYVGGVDAGVTRFLDYYGVQGNVQYVYSIRSVDAEGHISPFDNL